MPFVTPYVVELLYHDRSSMIGENNKSLGRNTNFQNILTTGQEEHLLEDVLA